MSQVTYIGPSGLGVDVPLPNGGSIHVDRGESVDLTDAHAERLLEQTENWQAASSPVANVAPAVSASSPPTGTPAVGATPTSDPAVPDEDGE